MERTYIHGHGGVAGPDCSRGGPTTTPQSRLNVVDFLLFELELRTGIVCVLSAAKAIHM